MNYLYKDMEYSKIVSHIMENKEFLKIDNCRHHGITRLEHSLRVSYFSYKISKKLKLNANETAVAGLLHDFFTNDELTTKEHRFSAFTHPKKCLKNADYHFELSDMQKDIIFSHMFPLIPTRPPKYLESWVVSMVDKVVAIYEFVKSYHKLYFFKLENVAIAMTIILARI